MVVFKQNAYHSRWVNGLKVKSWGYSLGLAIAAMLPPVSGEMPALAQLPSPPASSREQPSTSENILYVNPRFGDDRQGNGTSQSPLKSITQALRTSPPNTIISLAAGTYSTETGESFPLLLNPGTTLRGDPQTKGKNVVIYGGGDFVSPTAAGQNVTVVAIHHGTITGVTITNPNSRGYGLWIESANPVIEYNRLTRNDNTGISVNGASAPKIRQNYFYRNGGNGLVVYGTSRPEVQENIFDNTGYAVSVTQNAAPLLRTNRFTNNRIALVLEGNSQPILRNNVIENSREHGLVAIAQSRPDLGTRQEPGRNVFKGNRQLAIQNLSPTQTIVAFGNQIDGRILGEIDFFGNVASTPRIPSTSSPLPPLPPREAATPTPPRERRTETNQTAPPGEQESSDNPPASSTTSNPLPPPAQAGTITLNVPPPRNNRPLLPLNPPPQNTPPRNNRPLSPLNPPPRVAPNREELSDLLVLQPNLKPDLNAIQTPELDLLAIPEPEPQPDYANVDGNYRVVVATQNIRQESQVRSLFPQAFRIIQNGQILMQVGVFREEKNVEETLRSLESNGLNARVIPVRL